MDRYMDGGMNGWMDGWMDGCMDGIDGLGAKSETMTTTRC